VSSLELGRVVVSDPGDSVARAAASTAEKRVAKSTTLPLLARVATSTTQPKIQRCCPDPSKASILCTAASTECPEGPRLACHERNSSHAVVVPFDSTQRPAEPKHGARWIESYIASSESSRWLPCCCVVQFSCHTGQPHRCAESADVYLRSVWATLSMANIRLVAACGRRYYFHWALFKMERP
jgi:hypothetical protein